MKPLSAVAYGGGKYYMLDDIYNLLLKSEFNTMVDVFGGSGKISLNIPNNTLFGSFKVVYNDLDSGMINFYNVVKSKPREFLRALQDRLDILDDEYLNTIKYERNHFGMTDIEKAVAKYLWIEYAWSGKVSSTWMHKAGEKKINIDYVTNTIMMASKIAQNWNIENLDFDELIDKYNSETTMFYLDPPYRGSDLYLHNFTDPMFRRLKRALDRIEGQYLMNIDEDPFIRYVFGEPNMVKQYRNLTARPELAGNDRDELFYWKLD